MKTLVQYLHEHSPASQPSRVPRSELWIASQVLEGTGLTDNIQGHLELRKRCGMDILFLPLSESTPPDSGVNYRYFTLDDIRDAVSFGELPVGVIISGPFQRLVDRMGLTSAMLEFVYLEDGAPAGFQEEASQARVLISEALKLGVKVVVVADDIAWERSLYVAPEGLAGLLGPFYSDAVSDIHFADAFALFHSCGNAMAFVPHLVSCGFDGLAAWQSNAVDLVGLSSTHEHLTILAGLEGAVLDADRLAPTETSTSLAIARSLAKTGNFVLGSSCGLRDERSVANLRLFYSFLDGESTLADAGTASRHPD